MGYKIRNNVLWVVATATPLIGLSLAHGAGLPAADRAAVLKQIVNDDTWIVAYADVASMDGAVDSAQIAKLLSTFSDPQQGNVLAINALTSVVKTLQNSGVESVYVVAGLSDVYINGGPVTVVTLKSGSDTKSVVATLQGLVQTLSLAGGKSWLPEKVSVRPYGANTILVGSESVVARYEKLAAAKRDDLLGTMAKLLETDADLVAVFSAGPDFRRVIRELWPTLPEPLTPMKGELADKWLRLEFSAKSRPSFSGQLALQTTDAASARVFAALWQALPQCAQFDENVERQPRLKQALQSIIDTLPPQIEGSRVVMQIPTDESQLETLRELVSETTDAALDKTRLNLRMTQFKQLALAMHEYADKYKHLPPPTIRDKEGKPLLSWRVAILPYVEQKPLYEQFHLDEPWDSPHNRELIKQMPEIYQDPEPKIRAAAGDGKTTFVVPIGAGTAFDTKEGVMFREITDGTSNTLLIVEVVPERAVEWTKPADWEVDMDHPLAGIERTDRRQFTAAYCDGHGALMSVDTKPNLLRALLTRAGAEVINDQ